MFTKEQVRNIRNLYLDGNSSRQIAKLYNCSKFPILKIIKDLPKRKATEYKQHPCNNQFGQNNPNWKGGIKSIYDRIRNLTKYWRWKNSILTRDNFCCKSCGKLDQLEVHHYKTLKFLIQEYCLANNKMPTKLTEQDLLSDHFYDLSNGVVFCKDCHKDWHKLNGR